MASGNAPWGRSSRPRRTQAGAAFRIPKTGRDGFWKRSMGTIFSASPDPGWSSLQDTQDGPGWLLETLHGDDLLDLAGPRLEQPEAPLGVEVLRCEVARSGNVLWEGGADLQHLVDHPVVGPPREEYAPCGKLADRRASTPHVDRRAIHFAEDDLGCPVVPWLHVVRPNALADVHGAAEVRELQRGLVLRHEQVIRLHVAVDHLDLTESAQRHEDVPGVAPHVRKWQAAALAILLEAEAQVALLQLEDERQVPVVLKGLGAGKADQAPRALRVFLFSFGAEASVHRDLLLRGLP